MNQGQEAQFISMTGRSPAWILWEYVDSTEPAFSGVDAIGGVVIAARTAGAVNLVSDIKDAWRRGIWSSIHDHSGNPTLAGDGGLAASMANVAAYQDRTGAPEAACKTGGAQEAQFLSYLDRLADFFAALTDDTGTLIPVVFRPFHEINGTWFWWNGTDRQADMVLVWRKMVDYLRTTKGVTNVLFELNYNLSRTAADATSNTSAAYAGWYPGDTYVDILSGDLYQDQALSATANWALTGSSTRADYAALIELAKVSRKPMFFSEVGFQNGSAGVSYIWEQVGDDVAMLYRGFAVVGLWRAPWGPAPSHASAGSLANLTGRRYCITAP